MASRMDPERKALRNRMEELKGELEQLRPRVTEAFEAEFHELPKPMSVHTLHAYFGSYNRDFANCENLSFASPEDFQAEWFRGLNKEIDEDMKSRTAWSKRSGEAIDVRYKTIHRLAKLFQNQAVFDYAKIFLERNYYKKVEERKREKPQKSHLSLWFGDNKNTYGLLIAPAYEKGLWVSKISQVRRAKYEYWTVGHVLETGLIAPEKPDALTFDSLEAFLTFYRESVIEISVSPYEKAIGTKYLAYLKASDDVHQEPVLVPELRLGGLDKSHKYRLDFAVLNPHVMEYTGFELSPTVTHGALKSIEGMGVKEVNDRIRVQWNKETDKIASYRDLYDINVRVFADDALTDIEACFDEIRTCLAKRPTVRRKLSNEIESLRRKAQRISQQ